MTPLQNTEDKAALRRSLRIRRKSVDAMARRLAGKALVAAAIHNRLLGRGRAIGFYMPARSEIDVRPLLRRAQEMGVHCYLPIVPERGKKKLWFSHLGKRPTWVLNRYGILENRPPEAALIRAMRLQTLFMPLLGFDVRGYRIGMGGGYYDATLAYLSRPRLWCRPRVIGVAYSIQEIDRVPDDKWDIPLDAVLTEQGYRRFRNTQNSPA
jgi:5-formyltetrahydrofolate cyclo-ligase